MNLFVEMNNRRETLKEITDRIEKKMKKAVERHDEKEIRGYVKALQACEGEESPYVYHAFYQYFGFKVTREMLQEAGMDRGN